MKPQLFGPFLRQEGRARGASSCLAPGCTARRPRPVRGPGTGPSRSPRAPEVPRGPFPQFQGAVPPRSEVLGCGLCLSPGPLVSGQPSGLRVWGVTSPAWQVRAMSKGQY